MCFDNSYLLRNFEWAEFIYPKNKRKLIQLISGKTIDSSFGSISCDQVLGQPEGVVVKTSRNNEVVVFRATLDAFTRLIKRKTAIIFPQICSFIISVSDIRPGLNILEAGVGSGALTAWLLRALAGKGMLYSFEERQEFLDLAKENVHNFFSYYNCQATDRDSLSGSQTGSEISDIKDDSTRSIKAGGSFEASGKAALLENSEIDYTGNWVCVNGELTEHIFRHLESGSIDRVILDMLKPWKCIEAVTVALRPGGILTCYTTGLAQTSRLVETVRNVGFYIEPVVYENLQRKWHIEGLAIRPEYSGMKHSGFVVVCRRLFKEKSLPPQRRPCHKNKFDEDDTPAWLAQQIG